MTFITSRPTSGRRPFAAIQPQDLSWWRWTGFAGLLAADLCGLGGAREVALGFAAFQVALGLSRDTTPRRFRSQVQLAYAAVMALSLLPALEWLAWIQLAGTLALVLFGYCPLARTLVLVPPNRPVPFSWGLVRFALLSRPTNGSVLKALAARRDVGLVTHHLPEAG